MSGTPVDWRGKGPAQRVWLLVTVIGPLAAALVIVSVAVPLICVSEILAGTGIVHEPVRDSIVRLALLVLTVFAYSLVIGIVPSCVAGLIVRVRLQRQGCVRWEGLVLTGALTTWVWLMGLLAAFTGFDLHADLLPLFLTTGAVAIVIGIGATYLTSRVLDRIYGGAFLAALPQSSVDAT